MTTLRSILLAALLTAALALPASAEDLVVGRTRRP